MKTPCKFTALCRILVPVLMALLFGQSSVFGQANPYPPGQISYQGFLVDNNGLPLATNAPKNYNIIFRIYPTSTSDTNSPIWAEQQVVTVDKGYFSVLLGQGSAVGSQPNTNNLTSLFTGATASDRYIGLVVQGLAVGGDVEITPRLRLLASPYALLAANANAIVNSTGSNIVNTFGNFVGINKGGANPTSVLDVNGTITATNFMGGDATFGNVTVNGTIHIPALGASYAISYSGCSFPRTGGFTSHGGTVMLLTSASIYVNATGYHGITIQVDGLQRGAMIMNFNQINLHQSLPMNTIIVTGLAAGSHTVSIGALDANSLTDCTDNNEMTVLEFPF